LLFIFFKSEVQLVQKLLLLYTKGNNAKFVPKGVGTIGYNWYK